MANLLLLSHVETNCTCRLHIGNAGTMAMLRIGSSHTPVTRVIHPTSSLPLVLGVTAHVTTGLLVFDATRMEKLAFGAEETTLYCRATVELRLHAGPAAPTSDTFGASNPVMLIQAVVLDVTTQPVAVEMAVRLTLIPAGHTPEAGLAHVMVSALPCTSSGTTVSSNTTTRVDSPRVQKWRHLVSCVGCHLLQPVCHASACMQTKEEPNHDTLLVIMQPLWYVNSHSKHAYGL